MAGFSLLALLDDISAMLDDVAVMTKIAAKKTAGVLGDDLALNAQQVSGVNAERELAVVWAVAKGSLRNKAILIPAALLISVFAPYLLSPLLMLGGSYLCFEGAEKLAQKLFHKNKSAGKAPKPEINKQETEKKKIKGAIRTDFILSAEIIVIALNTVPKDASFLVQAGVLSLIGVLMTAGVYGLVGGIVKLDDLGLWMIRKNKGKFFKKLGLILLGAAPFLMRFLTVVGTAAMFLVGGGILAHGLPFFHNLFTIMSTWPLNWFWPVLFNAVLGIAVGVFLLGAETLFKRLTRTA